MKKMFCHLLSVSCYAHFYRCREYLPGIRELDNPSKSVLIMSCLCMVKEKESNAFVAEEKGNPIISCQNNPNEIIETLSVAKSVVAVAIGRLLNEGYLEMHREYSQIGVQTIFQAEVRDITEYYGDGDLGQYLILLPEEDIVTVRLIESESFTNPDKTFSIVYIDETANWYFKMYT